MSSNLFDLNIGINVQVSILKKNQNFDLKLKPSFFNQPIYAGIICKTFFLFPGPNLLSD
jgi:hypothetical protein